MMRIVSKRDGNVIRTLVNLFQLKLIKKILLLKFSVCMTCCLRFVVFRVVVVIEFEKKNMQTIVFSRKRLQQPPL